jgi:hypothetical protein
MPTAIPLPEIKSKENAVRASATESVPLGYTDKRAITFSKSEESSLRTSRHAGKYTSLVYKI